MFKILTRIKEYGKTSARSGLTDSGEGHPNNEADDGQPQVAGILRIALVFGFPVEDSASAANVDVEAAEEVTAEGGDHRVHEQQQADERT